MRIKSLLATSLLLSSPATLLIADETRTTNVLKNIDVNADTEAHRDDLELSSPTNLYQVQKSAQFATEVITQEEIQEYAPKDFFDLINKATGIDITYHGRKHPYFVNMRGGGNVTYILDGAILPATSDRILIKIPPAAIEEVQIVRTSTALTIAPSIPVGASNSGSGTNIGYIIIRTKRPKGTEGEISAYYEKATAQPAANGQHIYLGATFGDSSSLNGYIGGMVSRYDRPSKDEWFDGSDTEAGMINGGLNYGALSLNLMGYKDSGRFEFQRGVKTDGTLDNSKWYYDPIRTDILSLDGNILWSENQITLFSASQVRYSQEEYNEYFDKASYAHKHYSETTESYSLRHNSIFYDTTIRLGAQMSHSKGFGPNLSNAYNKFDTTIMGYAIALEQSLFNGQLILDAGYRQDNKHIKNSTAAKKESLATPDANNDVDLAPANVIAVGALWKINDTYTLNGRYYYGDEGAGDFDLLTQDGSELHPQVQNRFELGLEASYGKYFNPKIIYFDVDIENEKIATNNTYTDSDGNEYYYYTEENTHTKGLEIIANGTIAKNTSYKFSWTYLIANESTAKGVTVDSVGVTKPQNIFTALISHKWRDYQFNISGKNVSSYSSSTSAMGVATDVKLGDYTRIDANVAKEFKIYNYLVTGKIYGRNLTDDKYATRYTTGYYNDRGITLGAQLSLNF